MSPRISASTIPSRGIGPLRAETAFHAWRRLNRCPDRLSQRVSALPGNEFLEITGHVDFECKPVTGVFGPGGRPK
jgi:hypothetical protein